MPFGRNRVDVLVIVSTSANGKRRPFRGHFGLKTHRKIHIQIWSESLTEVVNSQVINDIALACT